MVYCLQRMAQHARMSHPRQPNWLWTIAEEGWLRPESKSRQNRCQQGHSSCRLSTRGRKNLRNHVKTSHRRHTLQNLRLPHVSNTEGHTYRVFINRPSGHHLSHDENIYGGASSKAKITILKYKAKAREGTVCSPQPPRSWRLRREGAHIRQFNETSSVPSITSPSVKQAPIYVRTGRVTTYRGGPNTIYESE